MLLLRLRSASTRYRSSSSRDRRCSGGLPNSCAWPDSWNRSARAALWTARVCVRVAGANSALWGMESRVVLRPVAFARVVVPLAGANAETWRQIAVQLVPWTDHH